MANAWAAIIISKLPIVAAILCDGDAWPSYGNHPSVTQARRPFVTVIELD